MARIAPQGGSGDAGGGLGGRPVAPERCAGSSVNALGGHRVTACDGPRLEATTRLLTPRRVPGHADRARVLMRLVSSWIWS